MRHSAWVQAGPTNLQSIETDCHLELPMLNRLFVIFFLALILGGPFAAIIAITDGTKAFGQEAQQKGMCLTTGTGCGNGNIIVTVASRI